jgi:anthranilate synthase component 1
VSQGEAVIIEQLRSSASLDLLDLHQHNPSRYPHLLQTLAGPDGSAGYDILFAFPGKALRLDASGIHFLSDHHADEQPPVGNTATFLNVFQEWWRDEKKSITSAEHPSLPFMGGWFLYLSYELCAEIEPSLRSRVQPLPDGMPIALAVRFQTAIIFDHSEQKFYCVCEPDCRDRIRQIVDDIASIKPNTEGPDLQLDGITEELPENYLAGARKIKNYIRAGDIFQANLSRRWRLNCGMPVPIADLYRRLRRYNPSPYAGLAVFDGFAILSSSPERLLRIRSGLAETRPIAGTRPRGSDVAQDNAYLHELIANPKERAEHIMLIDLERNDLGRVCQAGSVSVDEFMSLESYAHVHHIVSNVRGTLRSDVGPGQAIAAVFPGGTITGCPKVRCMQILSELESGARGAYTGSMGYVNLNGDMDLNILIRTITVQNREISLRAGAGIVADSEPLRE